MARQRRSTYRPELVGVGSLVYGFRHAEMQQLIPDVWCRSSEYPAPEESSGHWVEGYRVSVHNIGLGAARDIELWWEFDRAPYLARMREVVAVLDESLGVREQEGGSAIVYKGEKYPVGTPLTLDMRTRFAYLMPRASADEEVSIPLPPDFIGLASLLYTFAALDDGRHLDGFTETYGFLTLHVKYRDMAGRPYDREFDVRLSMESMVLGELPEYEKTPEPDFEGRLEIFLKSEGASLTWTSGVA